MNTPCKILAMAWMALRPFSTNVHADTINWEEVSHFFNFNTIEAEKRTHLETNIRLLVEEQLKLPSGQNLWKAFQFWENQHPELGFQFEFTLTPNPGAEVVLESLKNSFEGKQVFCFEILINKLFAEKLEADRILSENMLYRPCLIRLIDSDDPEKWEYHLREQELPFFITLAHEFLHALNQLERVKWVLRKFGLKNIDELLLKLNFEQICQFNDLSNVKEREEFVLDFEFLKENYENCILAFLDGIIPMQKFLMKYLQLNKYSKLLRQKYKALWQNGSNDDSLDEMTVILGKQRIIGKFEKVFISETTFLREYYKDNTIISWSHDSARSANFWKEMAIILNGTYVGQVLKGNRFGLDKSNIQEVYFNKNFLTISKFFYEGVGGYKCLVGIVNKKVNQLILPGIVEIIGRKGNNEEKIERFEVFANENLKIRLLPKYSRSVILNPNWQLEVCSNEYEISNISVDDDTFKKLKIDQKSILVIIDDTGLKYKYWFYDGQKEDSSITADSFETILKTKNAEVVLYYNGIEFLRVKKQK